MPVTTGSAEHAAAIEELERGLGPFADSEWRSDLSLLTGSVQVEALRMLADCETIVSLADRVPRSPGDERGGTPWTSFVREVAVAKRISDRAAQADIALARALLSRHPVTVAALRAGTAPAHRARVLVEQCARYDDDVAAVADRLLGDRLVSLPPWRLRQEVELLALRLDPDDGAEREAAATANRTASRTVLPDAQAEVVLTGPAPLVQRWWDALTAQARALKAAGDPRSLGALRFDLAVQTDPRGLTGSDALSEAVGIPPAAAPSPGSEAWGSQASDSASARSASSSDPLGLAARLPDDARCSRPVQAGVMVPAATALGLADEPGWLEGYGWISAPLSRRLLTVAELRKACVAPTTGRLVDVADRLERPRPTASGVREAVLRMVQQAHELRDVVHASQSAHDPSRALRRFVEARDRFCDGPTGTAVPAVRADKDHDRPWPHGPTAAWNLVSRAARTHQLKHAGWVPVRDETGTTWTSPAGQVVHTPRFDHPPPPPVPGRSLPDPDELAERDAALTRVREWPDSGIDEEPAAHDAGDTGTPVRGWGDEPAF